MCVCVCVRLRVLGDKTGVKVQRHGRKEQEKRRERADTDGTWTCRKRAVC